VLLRLPLLSSDTLIFPVLLSFLKDQNPARGVLMWASRTWWRRGNCRVYIHLLYWHVEEQFHLLWKLPIVSISFTASDELTRVQRKVDKSQTKNEVSRNERFHIQILTSSKYRV